MPYIYDILHGNTSTPRQSLGILIFQLFLLRHIRNDCRYLSRVSSLLWRRAGIPLEEVIVRVCARCGRLSGFCVRSQCRIPRCRDGCWIRRDGGRVCVAEVRIVIFIVHCAVSKVRRSAERIDQAKNICIVAPSVQLNMRINTWRYGGRRGQLAALLSLSHPSQLAYLYNNALGSNAHSLGSVSGMRRSLPSISRDGVWGRCGGTRCERRRRC